MNIDTETLAAYGPQENYTIHVKDSSGTAVMGEFDDVSKVEKYVMSEDAYNQRDDTFRKFKQQQMANNPKFAEAMNSKKIPEDFQKEDADKMEVGQRAQLN